MSVYICLHCGHHFEKIKVKSYDSQTGFAEEVCPDCDSEDIEEAGHCLKCGEYFPIDKETGAENYMIGSICKDCVEKRATRDNAFRFAWDYNIPHDELFGATEEEAKAFCLEDEYAFSEFLEKEED